MEKEVTTQPSKPSSKKQQSKAVSQSDESKNRVPMQSTRPSDAEMVRDISIAWNLLHKEHPQEFPTEYPNNEQLSLILSQNAVETGRDRKGMFNYNVGNITTGNWTGKYWVHGDWHYLVDENGNEIRDEKGNKIKKGHIAKFRAYPDLLSGVKDYLLFLSQSPQYKAAWSNVLNTNLEQYSKALREGKYYGADEAVYTAGLKSVYEQFNKKVQDPQLVAEVKQALDKSREPGAPTQTEVATLDKLQDLVSKLNLNEVSPQQKAEIENFLRTLSMNKNNIYKLASYFEVLAKKFTNF